MGISPKDKSIIKSRVSNHITKLVAYLDKYATEQHMVDLMKKELSTIQSHILYGIDKRE